MTEYLSRRYAHEDDPGFAQVRHAVGCDPARFAAGYSRKDFGNTFATVGARCPVIRTGERDEIPAHIRLAIYIRDDNRCYSCGTWLRNQTKHLDHLIPWSTGGCDCSSNLRTLCPPCNEGRSNIRDHAVELRLLPVTWWCLTCWSPDSREWEPIWYSCVAPAGWWELHPRIQADELLTLAYCAHCDSTGYTTDPL